MCLVFLVVLPCLLPLLHQIQIFLHRSSLPLCLLFLLDVFRLVSLVFLPRPCALMLRIMLPLLSFFLCFERRTVTFHLRLHHLLISLHQIPCSSSHLETVSLLLLVRLLLVPTGRLLSSNRVTQSVHQVAFHSLHLVQLLLRHCGFPHNSKMLLLPFR